MKQQIKQILDIADRTYYNWKREQTPVLSLLEKYFTKEDLEEFLETGTIERMEADTTQASELINKLKKYYKVGTSQELGERIGVAKTMANYAGVPIKTIQEWKQTKPELISMIIQSLIKKENNNG